MECFSYHSLSAKQTPLIKNLLEYISKLQDKNLNDYYLIVNQGLNCLGRLTVLFELKISNSKFAEVRLEIK